MAPRSPASGRWPLALLAACAASGRWPLALLAACAAAEGKYCAHGVYDAVTRGCVCSPGWGTAGITDTFDYLEGVCEQYHCQTDEKCQQILKIPYATCPVKNWNCYCGWKEAFMSYGHGFETFEDGGAECMGVLYTFSISASLGLKKIMLCLWMYFLILAILLLPFGRKRAICDHHRPTMWNSLRYCFGVLPSCRGECVLSPSYTMDSLKDDLAWTLFILDVGVWTYVALATAWLIAMFIWCMILWGLVLLVLVAVAIAGLCAACVGTNGGVGECCDCAALDGACCTDCNCCCMPFAVDSTGSVADSMYFMGPFPNNVWWGYNFYYGDSLDCCFGDCCCGGSRCAALVHPVAWLVYVFPHVPENAWGGLLGRYAFGTHHLTPVESSYQGGNCFIEFLRMGWQRPADLHDNMDWRRQVHDWLLQSVETAPQMGSGRGYFDGGSVSQRDCEFVGKRRSVLWIGGARVIVLERPFDMERDRLIESSFEDYEDNKCWICQSENDRWDLWLSCRHLFCSECSAQMLRRQMPCPLCRVSSSTVLRGREADAEDDESSGSE